MQNACYVASVESRRAAEAKEMKESGIRDKHEIRAQEFLTQPVLMRTGHVKPSQRFQDIRGKTRLD